MTSLRYHIRLFINSINSDDGPETVSLQVTLLDTYGNSSGCWKCDFSDPRDDVALACDKKELTSI